MKNSERHDREEIDNCDLKRQISLASATILVIANMIGTGVFTTSGLIMEMLKNSQAMLFSWFVGGLIALSGALSYGELGAMFPRAGGDYVFLRESFGKFMGFLSGWISLIVGFSAPIAAASMAFASYLCRIFPGSPGEGLCPGVFEEHTGGLSSQSIIAVGVILLFSLVHGHSVSFGSRVQNGLTTFKVAVILLFVIYGFLFGQGTIDHFSPPPHLDVFFSGEFAISLILVSFAYSGWNAAAYLGGEIKDAARNIPLALLLGTVVVIVLYVALNGIFVYALSAEEMVGVIDVGAKSALALLGGNVGRVFSIAMAVCLLSVISAMIMAGPRVYYAMARDGLFFKLFSALTVDRSTPSRSILLQAAIAAFMVITSTFETLLIYIGFTLSLFASLTVAGMILLRIRRPDMQASYKTFGYPIPPLVFILGNLWIIVFSIKENPAISVYGAITIVIGTLAYLFFNHAHGVKESSNNEWTG
ncbi:MAG: amino acid permease [Desulfatiglans sp.]|jgi:APA family basic amino acid/polyamine antiporter|nr:amino acid permease [Thermodesulfobacteriota bacterium]MEE4352208.1 amino acid permease [Desulfatiglans sp.]